MKNRKVLILLIFQLLSVASFCQSSIGLFGGYDNSTFYDKEGHHYKADYMTSPNYIIGVLFKEKQNKFLNLTFSLDYLKQSVEIDANYGGLSYRVTRNLDLDLYSINFRFLPELKIGNRFCVYLNFGPYFGWIVHSYYHNTGTYWVMTDPNNYENWDKYENAKEEFNGLDFGISSSLGMEIPIAENLKVNLNGNYSYGLNSITDGDIGSNAKINSKNLFFTAGLFYSLERFSLIRKLEEQ
jgi:opacity protein-like surface antigen